MNKIDQIKAEIRRLYEKYKDAFYQYKDDYHLGLYDGLDMAIRVIDSINEQPSEDLEQEQQEVDLKKVYDAYCEVCGHFHHTTPAYICRQACDYFKDFKALLNARKEG